MSRLSEKDISFITGIENMVFLAVGEKLYYRGYDVFIWNSAGRLMSPLDGLISINRLAAPSASMEMMADSVRNAETLLHIIKRMGEDIEDLVEENARLRRGEEQE